MTNEQYNEKCEATRRFREVVAELETKHMATYSDYAAYYIIKHGLYRDSELMKKYFDEQRSKTLKLKCRYGDEHWERLFYRKCHLERAGIGILGGTTYKKVTTKHSCIIEKALEYVPSEYSEVLIQFSESYEKE